MRMPRGYLKMSGANAAKPYFDCVQARFSGSLYPQSTPESQYAFRTTKRHPQHQPSAAAALGKAHRAFSDAHGYCRVGAAAFYFSALIATSKWYNVVEVWPLLMLVVGINLGLAVFGIYLIARSMLRMRQYDRLIADIKHSHDSLRRLIKS